MAHSSTVVVQAIADQLIVELGAYEDLLGRLPQDDCWPELLDPLGEVADRVCRCAQTLPPVSVPFTQFLISRTELIRALWPSSTLLLSDETLALCRVHAAAVTSLRRAAERVARVAAPLGASGHGAASALQALHEQRIAPMEPVRPVAIASPAATSGIVGWSVVGADRLSGVLCAPDGTMSERSIITSPVETVVLRSRPPMLVAVTSSGSEYWLGAPSAKFRGESPQQFIARKRSASAAAQPQLPAAATTISDQLP